MVVIVQKKKSASIVKGCVPVTNVLVQLSPQSQPFDLDFPVNADAMEFVARLHQPDGESYAQSVQSYMNSDK